MGDFETNFSRRFTGTRWRVVYGNESGPVTNFALAELQRRVQADFPYVLEMVPAGTDVAGHSDHLLILGTAASNPLIAELCGKGVLQIPEKEGGYAMVGLVSPWNDEKRVIAIGGAGCHRGAGRLCRRSLGRLPE